MSWYTHAATGIGSMPGSSADEAARIIAGEVPSLPFLAELPGRGVGSDIIGRSLGLLVDIAAQLVPSGWRLTSRGGIDRRRALDAMAFDLDAAGDQYAGAPWVKFAVCGPWTLAAGVELATGNRALTDRGAVRDLADSLAQGTTDLIADLRSRLPGTDFLIQVDEPGLPAVLRGSLPTPSGFGTVRAVDPADAGTLLRRFRESLPGTTAVHCCHQDAPVRLLRAAGFTALSLDVTGVGTSAARLDPIGEALQDGDILLAGVVPSTDPGTPLPLRDAAAPLLDLLGHLGLRDHALGETPTINIVPTPTCGLAAATPTWAVTALRTSTDLARALTDPPETWTR